MPTRLPSPTVPLCRYSQKMCRLRNLQSALMLFIAFQVFQSLQLTTATLPPNGAESGVRTPLPQASSFLNLSLGKDQAGGRLSQPTILATIRPQSGPLYHNATESIHQALNRATQVASDVIKGPCPDADMRIAPLQFENMRVSDHNTGPLMTVSASFVLMTITGIRDRIAYVYVPTALARHLTTVDPANNLVVWEHMDHSNMTPEQNGLALTQLWESIEHDMWITINTETSFALGDSDCALVSTTDGYFSIVSTLVHEIVHGLGVYSLVNENQSGGLLGHVSLFDALMQTKQGDCDPADAACFFFNESRVHHVTGAELGGTPLWVRHSKLHNPQTFDAGSSLSHFVEPDSVMNSTIAESTCRFQLTSTDLSALQSLGWDTCTPNATDAAWSTLDALFPAALLNTLLNRSTAHGASASPIGCHYYEHYDTVTGNCVCASGYYYVNSHTRYYECTSDDLGAAVISAVVFVIFVVAVCWCAWYCWSEKAKAPSDPPSKAQCKYTNYARQQSREDEGGSMQELDQLDCQVAHLFSGKPVFVIE